MFRLEIATDNAAFDDDPHTEIARILAAVAARVADREDHGTIRDLNGGTVGSFQHQDERE